MTAPNAAPETTTPADPAPSTGAPPASPDSPATAPSAPPPGEPPKDQPAPAPDAKATPAPAPSEVTYDLTLPEHALLDATDLERIAADARTRGLSPEEAQQEVVRRNATVAQYLAREEQAYAERGEQWKEATMADPRLGATPNERQAALKLTEALIDYVDKQHAGVGQKVKAYLNESFLGNNPDVAVFLHSVAKVGAEAKLISGSSEAPQPKSLAEVLYGPDGGRSKVGGGQPA